MKKIAIQGSQDLVERQEILKILRSWGGMNSYEYLCNTEGYYYVNYNNTISLQHGIFLPEYELLTLKEYKEKYMSKENSKELKIEIPKGYEIDKENSTFEKIVFKKVEKKLTYEDIADKLFQYREHCYIDEDGHIMFTSVGWQCPNVASTPQQLKRLLALNMLMNVAYYLNNGWKPNWNNNKERKYFIYYISTNKIFKIESNTIIDYGIVYFKSRELAEQAIEILGEETVKLALGVL